MIATYSSLGNKNYCRMGHKGKPDACQKHESEEESEPDCTDNAPLQIPIARLPDKLRNRGIVVNISHTIYSVVEEVVEELGWRVQRREGVGDWDLWWTDHEIYPQTLIRMNLHQKINHFPGIEVLARKNLLALNLTAMQEYFPDDYDFFPRTWAIPLQFPQFRRHHQSTESMHTYIVKPEAMSQGRGIFLTRNIDEIATGEKLVVQSYVNNPYLIEGLKFDLRIYVLLAGTNPLRLYRYKEGLARFATQKYQEPSLRNMSCSYIHLTNYSLNKKNPKYVYSNSLNNTAFAHKRSISCIYELLRKRGVNVDRLQIEIDEIIIKTVISGLPSISHQYRCCQPDSLEDNMCFHILGIDIMLDAALKPLLIEINHTPSFETGTPLDHQVKKGLIEDTLQLMRVTETNKKKQFKRAKVIIKHRLETGKRDFIKTRESLAKQAQALREHEEGELLGNFQKIYPFDQTDAERSALFQSFIDKSIRVSKQTDQLHRKIKEGDKMDTNKQQSKKTSKITTRKLDCQSVKLQSPPEDSSSPSRTLYMAEKSAPIPTIPNRSINSCNEKQILCNIPELEPRLKKETKAITERHSRSTVSNNSSGAFRRHKVRNGDSLLSQKEQQLHRLNEVIRKQMYLEKQRELSQRNAHRKSIKSKVRPTSPLTLSIKQSQKIKTEREYIANFVKPKVVWVGQTTHKEKQATCVTDSLPHSCLNFQMKNRSLVSQMRRNANSIVKLSRKVEDQDQAQTGAYGNYLGLCRKRTQGL